ncbi:MAG: ATP-binding protein [Acidobacteria bacterium]|nr:ATP-binding protein [Acidobacteriota bacterium]
MVAVFGKPISEVTLDDVQRLVENRVPESRSLDYKAELYEASPKGFREFASDVAAFANTDGGLLVFGVSERRVEGGQTSEPEAIVGLVKITLGTFSRFEQSLGAMLAPRITGIGVKLLEAADQRSVLLVNVPRSWQAPHMVTADHLTRFYYRTGTGREVMDVDQIRTAFRSSASFNDRSNELRELRAALILAGQVPAPLASAVLALVVQVIPAQAFDGGSLGMDALNAARGTILPLWGGADFVWNIDGLLLAGDLSYAQVFTTGVIEYGDSVIFKGGMAHGDQLRGALGHALTRSLRWLAAVDTPPPVNIAVTLLRARDQRFAVGMRQVGAFDRDVIRVPLVPVRSNDPTQVEKAVDEILDAVSRAAGFMRFQ